MTPFSNGTAGTAIVCNAHFPNNVAFATNVLGLTYELVFVPTAPSAVVKASVLLVALFPTVFTEVITKDF